MLTEPETDSQIVRKTFKIHYLEHTSFEKQKQSLHM